MKLHRFFANPGVCIALVGLVVVAGAILLWRAAHCGEGEGTGQVREAQAAVAVMLVDVAQMAYEEPLAAPMEDGVKQADFALVQAMLRGSIRLEDAFIETRELRDDPQGPYTFQRIRLVVGADPEPFLNSLNDSLRAWADDARLAPGGERPSPGGSRLWTIAVNGVVTHELLLASSPTQEIAPPRSAGTFRRRASGAPARLVIVMDDLGEDMGAVRTLVGLPFPVTFAVWPHSSHARQAAEAAHEANREVLVHQPTEPIRYPEIKPGPNALFSSLNDTEIESRVLAALTRVPYAIGMNNHMGSRFTRDARAVAAMLRPLKRQGIFVLDSLTHPGSVLYAEARRMGIPALKRDIFLDAVHDKATTLRQLRRAEDIALVSGSAIAIGHPLPETLAALREWNSQRNTAVSIVRLTDLLPMP